MPKPIDITGFRFGRWTVLARDGHIGLARAWLCRCDCGKERRIPGSTLRNGYSRSCGCQSPRCFKHGSAPRNGHTQLYRAWKNMRARCSNPNVPNWKDYGGRGITVCEEWQRDFESFRDWALANGYAAHLSIDRVDNEKGYSPANCRFATRKEQASNKRRHGNDKLKAEQIPAIRADPRLYREIAAEYGVVLNTIYDIKKRRTWRDIP